MSYILENNLKYAKSSMMYTEEIIKSARAKDKAQEQDNRGIFTGAVHDQVLGIDGKVR